MISWIVECSSKRLRGEVRDENVIFFSDKDLVKIHIPNNDPIVVSMMIAKHSIKKILVDCGSLADVIFYNIFIRMNRPLNQLPPIFMCLVAFNRVSI